MPLRDSKWCLLRNLPAGKLLAAESHSFGSKKTLANLSVRLLRRAIRDTIKFDSWHKEKTIMKLGKWVRASVAVFSALFAGVTMLSSPVSAGVITVNVKGNNNPFLAGAPDGATALGDSAPEQSPTLALTGFDTTHVLTFSAIGGFNFGGGVPIATADGQGLGNDNMSPENLGISGPMGIRFDALVGVFLDDTVPSGMAPASLNSGISFTSLSPGLRQIFWIGDGLTGTGTGDVQQFFAPTGATRLFLGSTDGFGWFNNSGVSEVTISFTAVSTSPTSTVPEPASLCVFGLGLACVLGMRSRIAGSLS